MGFRKVGAGRGAAWIIDGLASLAPRPLPFIGVCLWLALLSVMPVVSLVTGLLLTFFYGGLVVSAQVQAQRGPVRLGLLFAAFVRPGALRRLLPAALLKLGFALLAVMVVVATLGPEFFEALRSTPTPEKLDPALAAAVAAKLPRLLLVLGPASVLVNWLLLFAVPRAMLDEVSGSVALREAFSAVLANLGALLINLACQVLLVLLFSGLLLVPLTLAGVLAAASPALGSLLQLLVFVSAVGLMFVLDSLVMYQAWRDVFAVSDAPPAPVTEIEA